MKIYILCIVLAMNSSLMGMNKQLKKALKRLYKSSMTVKYLMDKQGYTGYQKEYCSLASISLKYIEQGSWGCSFGNKCMCRKVFHGALIANNKNRGSQCNQHKKD